MDQEWTWTGSGPELDNLSLYVFFLFFSKSHSNQYKRIITNFNENFHLSFRSLLLKSYLVLQIYSAYFAIYVFKGYWTLDGLEQDLF